MCGVIYFKGDGNEYRELIVSILMESRVRGLHAFGLALKEKPTSKWKVTRTFNINSAITYLNNQDHFFELIGHTRYDTSGDWKVLENNQPIVFGKDNILAFNGVVRMSLKEEYEAEFGCRYETANDGEIPLRMMAEDDQEAALSLLSEPGVSFAGVFSVGGRSFALRNERRPLWHWRSPGATFVFSTQDIWNRAVKRVVTMTAPIYTFGEQQVPVLERLWL